MFVIEFGIVHITHSWYTGKYHLFIPIDEIGAVCSGSASSLAPGPGAVGVVGGPRPGPGRGATRGRGGSHCARADLTLHGN